MQIFDPVHFQNQLHTYVLCWAMAPHLWYEPQSGYQVSISHKNCTKIVLESSLSFWLIWIVKDFMALI